MDKRIGRKQSDNILPSDLVALKETHRLVRDDTYDEQHCDDWKVRMARRYYNKLYKEYAIIDLSRYKEGQYGLRWRTEAEVVAKKGQSICGAKDCVLTDALNTLELPFKYIEAGEIKRELIKVCLCHECFDKLNFSRELVKTKALEVPEAKKRKGKGGTVPPDDDREKNHKEKSSKRFRDT